MAEQTENQSAKAGILGSIRKGLKRDALPADRVAVLERRIADHPRNLIPNRTDLPPAERVDLFVTMAQRAAATVTRLNSLSRVPKAVSEYLAGHNLPQQVRVAPDPDLGGIPWADQPTLEVAAGKAEADDSCSVTGCVAGIAETGTLMLRSSPGSPITLNFLPDTHIVVLRRAQIVGPYEEAWDLLRGMGAMPRTVNMITGPSRTGDIEQTLQLGAHGPRCLHILLIDEDQA